MSLCTAVDLWYGNTLTCVLYRCTNFLFYRILKLYPRRASPFHRLFVSWYSCNKFCIKGIIFISSYINEAYMFGISFCNQVLWNYRTLAAISVKVPTLKTDANFVYNCTCHSKSGVPFPNDIFGYKTATQSHGRMYNHQKKVLPKFSNFKTWKNKPEKKRRLYLTCYSHLYCYLAKLWHDYFKNIRCFSMNSRKLNNFLVFFFLFCFWGRMFRK